MRFARLVFAVAGTWGVLVLTPLYFLYDYVGAQYPPPVTHPDFYYGFAGVALAWQIAFLIIATDPVRLRPLMIAAILEKSGYVTTLSVLYAQGRLQAGQAVVAVPDFGLAVLFVLAFLKTRTSAPA